RADQVCYSNFCYQLTCTSNDDCSDNTVCVRGVCTPFGQTCNNNNECFGSLLACVSGRCVQCVTSADCPGGVCGGDGVCYPNCSGIEGACPTGTVCLNNF